MANWAIVIGINHYWRKDFCLRGAVPDALRFREWLLDPGGGAVPAHNLQLLLGPADYDSVPAGVQYQPATKDMIVRVVDRLLQRSGGEGERLYFYFAGHGLSMEVALNKYEHALLATDFEYVVADRSLDLSSLMAYFKATSFADQFFFLDACRNVLDKRFEIGRMPNPPERDFSKPEPQQFVLYATSPGVKAVDQLPGHEGGAFTDALLGGLKGKGTAKTYDAQRDAHIVRWQSLFDYVRSVVEERKLLLDLDSPLIQLPRQAGERGAVGRDSNPELATFDPDDFPAEPLEVFVAPDPVVPVAELEVYEPGSRFPVETKARLTGIPATFQLPPKPYTVYAQASGYQPRRKSWPVELYKPLRIDVSLDPLPPDTAGGVVTRGGAPDLGATRGTTRGVVGAGGTTRGVARGIGAPENVPGRVEVATADSLARLELTDLTGRVLLTASGHLTHEALAPGGYRVRLRTPEGEVIEEVIDLLPGEDERVSLGAPPPHMTPVMGELMSRAHFHLDTDNMVHVSEALGPLAAVELSTVLTLAAVIETYSPDQLGWGHRLRSLEFATIAERIDREAESGLLVAIADEQSPMGPDAQVEQIELYVWPFGEARPEQPLSPEPVRGAPSGIAEAGAETRSCSHWLVVAAPGRPATCFVLHLLPGHLTLLVLHRHEDGEIFIFQHTPLLSPSDPSSAAHALHRARHFELIQRYILQERYESLGDPGELLSQEWTEPVTRLVGAYLLLRLGRVEEAAAEARRLRERFSEWSDVHLILGEWHTSRRETQEAVSAYSRALDCGVPTFAGGLAILMGAVERHGIQHRNRRLLAAIHRGRVPGVLWTAFTPPEVTELGTDA